MADKDKIDSELKRIQKIVNAAGSPPVIVLGSVYGKRKVLLCGKNS